MRFRLPVMTMVVQVIVVAVIAGACSASAPTEDAEPTPQTSATSEPSTTSPAPAEDDPPEPFDRPDALPDDAAAALADLDGKLAIGLGRTVAVARPDGLAYIELDDGETTIAGQPTWSRDGQQLVWSSISPQTQEARIQFFDEEGVVDGDPVRIPVPGQPIFYFQWRHDDEQLLYLRNSSRSQTVEAGVLSIGGGAAWMADGSPFFVSWAPEAALIAGHVADQEMRLYDPEGSRPLDVAGEGATPSPPGESPVEGELLAPAGGFSAPAWLDDDRLLLILDGWLSIFSISERNSDRLLEINGPVRFVVSPDRSRAALQIAGDIGRDGPLEASFVQTRPVQSGHPLLVIDLETGEVETITENRVVAWEWSPDSSKLAWLEFDGPPARRLGRWQFWSLDGPVAGNATAPSLRLSDKELVNYLPFFAQYAQSMTRWSPDSTAFALVGSAPGGAGVWIHFVDRSIPAVLVAPGDIVAWGPGPAPPPSAGRSPA